MKKQIKLITTFVATMTAFALSANAALVTTSSISASQDRNNFGGTLSDLTSGEEFVAGPNGGTKGDLVDPSTWRTWTTNYQEAWNQQSSLQGAANGKIAWVVLDFGSDIPDLDSVYFWNHRHASSQNNRVANYNLYLASDLSGNALPPTTNTNPTVTDYDFAGGGWTQLGGTNNMPQRGNINQAGGGNAADQVISLGGSTARYLGIEILTAGGGTGAVGDWVGLNEVAVTAADPVPEPSSTALLGLGGLALILRRRK